jgi:nucleotide-binding universal stress UspA family protein
MAGFHPQTLVVPIDFSDLAIAALDKAIDIAGDVGKVHAIHVLPDMGVVDPIAIYENISDASRIEAIEKVIRERFAEPRYEKLIIHAAVGDPGHEVADYSQRVKADLIVISSHGYGFLKHLLLGSVAERIVRLAHCPVLVMRT